MRRFLSNATKIIDSKGRVSVPSFFRTILINNSIDYLYCFQDFFFPAISAGDSNLLERFEQRIEENDPLSIKANQLSLLIHGGGVFLKMDSEGRIMVTDFIREFTEIKDEVTFVGRGNYFQLWNPKHFKTMQAESRKKYLHQDYEK